MVIRFKFYKVLSSQQIFTNTRKYGALCSNTAVPRSRYNPSYTLHICSKNVKNIRYLSIDGYTAWLEKTATNISHSEMVKVAQNGLIEFHNFTGLPWWATIICSTVLLRAVMTLPLTVYQYYILAKVENISLELKELNKELQQEAARAKMAFSLSDQQTFILYKRSLKKQWTNLVVRDNCHPFKASLVMWIQIPVWISMSFALRNLVNMQPVPDAAALITYTELTLGGLGWIPNLTMPDQSWIIPVAFGLTNLAIIEFQKMSKIRDPSKMANILTNVFRVVTIMMVPLAANVPSCMCLYWMTSSGFGLVQNLTLLSPKIRRLVRIPEAPSELKNPYEHIKNELLRKTNKLSVIKK